MKIAVLSGKGGTGKTLVSVNLAAVANQSVYMDCDVEEPNGHLFFKPENIVEEEVTVAIPTVDNALCTGCRKCVDFCKFNALAYIKDQLLIFDEVCHSCGGCIMFCPEHALTEKPKVIGKVQTGTWKQTRVSTGILEPGEASGTPIIKRLMALNEDVKAPTIIDCPPGSACIVMDSIKEADYCILVAEPTIFGVHNLQMVHELVQLFNKPYGLVLNKCLAGEENPAERYALENKINILARIPYDNELGRLNSNAHIAVFESKKYRNQFLDLLSKVEEEVRMKQLLILSGKGGTGKTTVASAFIKLADAKAFADCDVDAPNLHLIMGQKTEPAKSYYYGLPTAKIDQERCIDCDLCRQHCRFDAITATDGYRVDPYACEGCGVCEALCPVQAITLNNLVSGDLMRFVDQGKIFSTAKLRMGSGTSGMLVSEVKKQLKPVPLDTELVIIDGSPGIGCPVIASITGVDMVLIVTEPSISGISDMERIIYTAAKFGVETLICVNKYDTNLENTVKIEQYCQTNGLHFVGRIPFDSDAVKAINNGQTIVDVDCTSGRAVRDVYQQVMTQLFKE